MKEKSDYISMKIGNDVLDKENLVILKKLRGTLCENHIISLGRNDKLTVVIWQREDKKTEIDLILSSRKYSCCCRDDFNLDDLDNIYIFSNGDRYRLQFY